MIEISLKAEELFHIGSGVGRFTVTNSLTITVITTIILAIIGWQFRKRLSLIPGKFQNFIEYILEELLKLMDSVLGSRKAAEKYLPLVATIFLLIMLSNWLGLVPGVGSIGLHGFHEGRASFTPLFRAPAADLNFTLAIAIVAVFAVNIFAIIAIGFRKHARKFFTLKNPIHTFIGLLEFISELAKMISFSFRLFGNIFAGEVLLIILGVLVPYLVPLPFIFLEIFVGFIQAFVFAMLTLVFIAIAIAEEAH